MFLFALMSFALFYALKYIIVLPWKHFHLYPLKSNSSFVVLFFVCFP